MEKRSRFAGLIELVALSALVISLVLTIQFLRVNPETATKQTPESVRLPLCQFNEKSALEITMASLDDYVFSDPQIVHMSPGNIGLVDWLPDNQLVLLTRDDTDQNLQTIELFNPQNGESQIYAERRNVPAPPIWLPELRAVAYSEMKVLDATKQPVVFTRQLWISQGDGNKAQLIADNVSSFYLAVDPDTNQIAYLTDRQLSLQNVELNITYTVDFDPNKWKFSKESDRTQPLYYEMAWKPGSMQIAFYNANSFLLLDVNTGEACEVDLDGWASVARWSPDGRFLAVVRTNSPLPVKYSDLAVLDVTTGKFYTLQIAPESNGQHYVTDIAWAPDSRRLIAIGEVRENSQSEKQNRGLYFVDFASGQSIRLSLEQSFGGGWWGSNMVWSSDGSKLLVACPTEKEERLCLILVQRKDIPSYLPPSTIPISSSVSPYSSYTRASICRSAVSIWRCKWVLSPGVLAAASCWCSPNQNYRRVGNKFTNL